jgi:hypothetical protein
MQAVEFLTSPHYMLILLAYLPDTTQALTLAPASKAIRACLPANARRVPLLDHPVPMWAVMERWAFLTDHQRMRALKRAAWQEDLPTLTWVLRQPRLSLTPNAPHHSSTACVAYSMAGYARDQSVRRQMQAALRCAVVAELRLLAAMDCPTPRPACVICQLRLRRYRELEQMKWRRFFDHR